MATLRSRKFLSCFYCGRRSRLRFEGQKSFLCLNCDATNWLDEYGSITDPPTSPPVERPQVQFAIPRSSVPRSPTRSLSPNGVGSEDSIFCGTCLRNQHMLTSSLAQFEWPDDHNSAEYAAREKRYWALRRDLEKRYPQMCAVCEPKVEKKLHEASYTAQTDHLRRMMDRTRSSRQEVKKRGVLDAVDWAGRWIWSLGFALQFLWHIAMLWSLVIGLYGLSETDSWMTRILKIIHQYGSDRLPRTDQLMRWAIGLGFCSLPWNPRFKQTIRGFTAHYLGFKHWYTYQFLILLVRYAGLSMAQYSSSEGLQIPAQLGAQLAIALLMTFIYHASRKSIHTDTTPLFQPRQKVNAQKSQVASKPQRDQNDLGSILDEISQSRVEPTPYSPSPNTHQTTADNIPFGSSFSSSFSRSHENGTSGPSFDSMRISDPVIFKKPEPKTVHYEEEMDWTPSASQHRAFSSYNPYKVKNMNPRFSDTPIEARPGPIWYKVPPAPTTPAQRLRNPPMRPIIRESPKEVKENFFQSTARGPLEMGSSFQGSLSDIKFAEPKFFAPEDKDDPRDNLSRMFASSFSISPDPDEERYRKPGRAGTSSVFGIRQGTHGTTDRQNHRVTRFVELFVLAGALYAWVSALKTDEPYGLSLALTSIIACLIVSIRLAADLQVDIQLREGKQPPMFSLSWANLGLAQVISSLILAWSLWSGIGTKSPWSTYGSAHIATAIIHHMVHIFL
ncbi:Ima1 N-terminal domain-containing protein [Daldinia vernicosa]|uniref:Ima1 N-terminal domain-containing protein n=1 Tax=Daldinia vernicosa TaxID=114800 RepID=UPI002007BAC2|nr:Ima1 N-terminal domain-containing protein [Daldinia vernicosa]KAI0846582.1 Ima1 N-terminal domain-containing protein [Daldinia vernicosa]